MGLKLLTDDKATVIYRKDKVSKAGNPYSTYCTKVSSKDSDGNWQSAFINVKFKKNVEVGNKAKISIKNSFPTLDTYNGNTNIAWMILEFDVLEAGETPNDSADGFVSIDDGDVPDFMKVDGELEEMPFK